MDNRTTDQPKPSVEDGDLLGRTRDFVSVTTGYFTRRARLVFKHSVPLAGLALAVGLCLLGILVSVALAARSYLLEQGWTPAEGDLGMALAFGGMGVTFSLVALARVMTLRNQGPSEAVELPKLASGAGRKLGEDLTRVARTAISPAALVEPHTKKIVLGAALCGFLLAFASGGSHQDSDSDPDL